MKTPQRQRRKQTNKSIVRPASLFLRFVVIFRQREKSQSQLLRKSTHPRSETIIASLLINYPVFRQTAFRNPCYGTTASTKTPSWSPPSYLPPYPPSPSTSPALLPPPHKPLATTSSLKPPPSSSSSQTNTQRPDPGHLFPALSPLLSMKRAILLPRFVADRSEDVRSLERVSLALELAPE